jgi:hypothetical protein
MPSTSNKASISGRWFDVTDVFVPIGEISLRKPALEYGRTAAHAAMLSHYLEALIPA